MGAGSATSNIPGEVIDLVGLFKSLSRGAVRVRVTINICTAQVSSQGGAWGLGVLRVTSQVR